MNAKEKEPSTDTRYDTVQYPLSLLRRRVLHAFNLIGQLLQSSKVKKMTVIAGREEARGIAHVS